jgi:hypothetical protein
MGDAAELEKGVELYLSGQYDACLEHFSSLLDTSRSTAFTEPQILEKGRLYAASCAVLSGRLEASRTQLKNALSSNPLMPTPDSLSFPPPLVGLFLEVREEVQQVILAREREQVEKLREQAEAVKKQEEARASREAELLRIATEERVTVQGSRVIAAIPFGAGQFQNGNSLLGSVLLVTEVASLATAGIAGAVYLQLYSDAIQDARANGEKNARIDSTFAPGDEAVLRTTHSTWAFSTVAFLALATVGIVEAQVAFQEERVIETRKRSLPKGLDAIRPSAAPPSTAPKEKGVTVVPYGHVGADGFFIGSTFRF